MALGQEVVASEMPVGGGSQILRGPRIQLCPLRAGDARELVLEAGDGALWDLPFTVVLSDATVDDYIRSALGGQAAGTAMPFATRLRATDQVIGSTRLWKIDRKNRKLEIGGTWLSASWQRTFVNTEAKYLMLRSRAVILRLGAKEEGIVRNERIMPDGRKRNSVRFSIIGYEWPAVTQRLEQWLHST